MQMQICNLFCSMSRISDTWKLLKTVVVTESLQANVCMIVFAEYKNKKFEVILGRVKKYEQNFNLQRMRPFTITFDWILLIKRSFIIYKLLFSWLDHLADEWSDSIDTGIHTKSIWVRFPFEAGFLTIFIIHCHYLKQKNKRYVNF